MYNRRMRNRINKIEFADCGYKLQLISFPLTVDLEARDKTRRDDKSFAKRMWPNEHFTLYGKSGVSVIQNASRKRDR